MQYTGYPILYDLGGEQNTDKQLNKKPMGIEVYYFIIHLFLVRYSSVHKWS